MCFCGNRRAYQFYSKYLIHGLFYTCQSIILVQLSIGSIHESSQLQIHHYSLWFVRIDSIRIWPTFLFVFNISLSSFTSLNWHLPQPYASLSGNWCHEREIRYGEKYRTDGAMPAIAFKDQTQMPVAFNDDGRITDLSLKFL